MGLYSHLWEADDVMGQFIADLLDELSVQDDAYQFAMRSLRRRYDPWQDVVPIELFPSPPPLRRQRAVRFVPASTLIGSHGSRTNPIVID